jgi:hypothetical protein
MGGENSFFLVFLGFVLVFGQSGGCMFVRVVWLVFLFGCLVCVLVGAL